MIDKPILFAATSSAEASREFYEQKLGLSFVAEFPYALVFDLNGIMLRVQKVEQVVSVPYTTLGFAVDDLRSEVQSLQAKGIEFEQYSFLEQDEAGIWTTPDGALVAWCQDPDGSIVSLTQHPD